VAERILPELGPVWRESFRVLRPGGILLAGFMNPDVFIFDVAALERDELGVSCGRVAGDGLSRPRPGSRCRGLRRLRAR
jgi:hypothetical protein